MYVLCIVMCVYLVYRSTAVGTQFSSWEAMLKDTEEEAKVMVIEVYQKY